jgi:uncharacterized membrane protein YgdD (TMEM256/DUF423 family)
MHKMFLLLGAVFAGLGVVLGAFGAHGLKQLVGPETVGTFQTGVQYQMYHAFALLLVGVLYERFPARSLTGQAVCLWAALCFFPVRCTCWQR